MITRYQILYDRTPSELEIKVIDAMADGWQPYGFPTQGSSDFGNFFQAMVQRTSLKAVLYRYLVRKMK